jgi:hypothetical protein
LRAIAGEAGSTSGRRAGATGAARGAAGVARAAAVCGTARAPAASSGRATAAASCAAAVTTGAAHAVTVLDEVERVTPRFDLLLELFGYVAETRARVAGVSCPDDLIVEDPRPSGIATMRGRSSENQVVAIRADAVLHAGDRDLGAGEKLIGRAVLIVTRHAATDHDAFAD